MRKTQRNSGHRGAAVIELALVAPLFLILILGIVEVGRALIVQQVLVNASREGARSALRELATIDSVKDRVVECLESSSLPINRDDIVVTPDPTEAVNGSTMSVTVSVSYQDVTWLPRTQYLDGRLEATTVMRF